MFAFFPERVVDELGSLLKPGFLLLSGLLTLAQFEVAAQIRHVRIGDHFGGFTGAVEGRSHTLDVMPDFSGSGVANIGDLDGDGIDDLAVGAPEDDDGDYNLGAKNESLR